MRIPNPRLKIGNSEFQIPNSKNEKRGTGNSQLRGELTQLSNQPRSKRARYSVPIVRRTENPIQKNKITKNI